MIELYVHTSPSGKRYVGIATRGAAARWKNHVQAARRGSMVLFHRAIRKYGPAAFVSEVLACCLDMTAAHAAERAVIAELRTMCPAGYNITAGGQGTLGRVKSPRERQAISASKTGKTLSPDVRARMSAAHIGLTHTPEAKLKIAAGNRDRVWTEESRAKLRASKAGNNNCTGRAMSDDTRAKISAANTGRVRSAETRAKMSESRRGVKRGPMSDEQKAYLRTRPVSQETRERMSAAQRARRERAKQGVEVLAV